MPAVLIHTDYSSSMAFFFKALQGSFIENNASRERQCCSDAFHCFAYRDEVGGKLHFLQQNRRQGTGIGFDLSRDTVGTACTGIWF